MFGKKKIGIALSGGAARGLAHIGVLLVLDEIGVEISAVSGCSMGAIIGAIYSLGISLQDIINYIKNTDWKGFLLFSAFGLSRAGILNDKKVDEVLTKFLGKKTFDDCIKPFCCVAVDIISGKKIVINSGSLKEAVRASISVPGIFAPVYKNGGILVDGGVIEPLPTEAIQIFNCNFIIASSIIFEKESDFDLANEIKKSTNPSISSENVIQKEKFSKKSNNINTNINIINIGNKVNNIDKRVCEGINIRKLSIQTILDKSMSIMHGQMVKSYLEKAHIVIEPKVGQFGFFDLAKGEKIIQAGRKAAERKIPEIKQKLKLRQ